MGDPNGFLPIKCFFDSNLRGYFSGCSRLSISRSTSKSGQKILIYGQ
jgi:hypothetical protein